MSSHTGRFEGSQCVPLYSGGTCEEVSFQRLFRGPTNEGIDIHPRFGKINVLVNNASKQYMYKEFVDTDLDKTEDIFKANIIQMIAVTKFALAHMSRGDWFVV